MSRRSSEKSGTEVTTSSGSNSKYQHLQHGWRRSRASIGICAVALIGLATISVCTTGRSLRGSAVNEVKNVLQKRGLQASGAVAQDAPTVESTATTIPPLSPNCTSLTVPAAALNLAGIYTHNGRFNSGRPVYANTEVTGKLFAHSAAAGSSADQVITWFITSSTSPLFLSLTADVYEPVELHGPQSWTRHNDRECPTTTYCTVDLNLGCAVWSTDLLPTEAPTSPVAGDAAGARDDALGDDNGTYADNDTFVATPAPTMILTARPTTLTPTAAPTVPEKDIEGCKSLDVRGGERSGIYLFNETYANDRPIYTMASEDGGDSVFSAATSVCAAGWGVVNSTWSENEGWLGENATANEAFLHYAAGLDMDLTAGVGADGCSVNVWYMVAGGVADLGSAAGDTFLAVSAEDDPSRVALWAKYTPATATSGAKIAPNSWVQVACAGATEEVAVTATTSAADGESAVYVRYPSTPADSEGA